MIFVKGFLVIGLVVSPAIGQLAYPCDILDTTCEEEQEYSNVTERLMSGRRCFCDKKCSTLGDCCEVQNSTIHSKEHLKCVPLRFSENPYVGVYVRHVCGDGLTSCLFAEDDPLTLLPAYSSRTQTTYRNLFCALCNQENFYDLKFGEIKFECVNGVSGFSNETLSNPLRFFTPKTPDSPVPNFCRLVYRSPTGSGVTKCIPSIDSCPADSNNEDISACSSYMRTVFDEDVLYKNPDCARCNGAFDNLTTTGCLTPLLKITSAEHSTVFTPKGIFNVDWSAGIGYSMTILLDLNLDNGNVVGADRKCQEGSVFDPWLNRCRNVVCPGSKNYPVQQFVDGICRSGRDALLGKQVSVWNNTTSGENFTAMRITHLENCPRLEFDQMEYEFVDGMIYVNSSGRFYNLSDVFFNGSVATVCLSDE